MKKSELRKLIREVISENQSQIISEQQNIANFPTTAPSPQFIYTPNSDRYKVICPEGYKFNTLVMQGMAGAQNKSQLFNRDGSNPPFTAYDELHIGTCLRLDIVEPPRPGTSQVKPDREETSPVKPSRPETSPNQKSSIGESKKRRK